MSEVVQLDDFKEDLKVINEKLDILTKHLEKEKELNSTMGIPIPFILFFVFFLKLY